MSTLLLDIGNSRLKWALLKQGQRSAQLAVPYPSSVTAQQSLAQYILGQIDSLLKQQQAARLVVVQVLGAAFAAQLQQYCEAQGYDCLIVASDNNYGLTLAYAEPALFGADRFVALVAAQSLAPQQACVVVDAGTAVTIDALDAQGAHQGGLILPGLRLLVDSLIQRTQAPHMSAVDVRQVTVLATNTQQAMGSGCVLALTSAIEGIYQRMQQHFDTATALIVTGGDAVFLQAQLQPAHQLQADLLMLGLQIIAEQT